MRKERIQKRLAAPADKGIIAYYTDRFARISFTSYVRKWSAHVEESPNKAMEEKHNQGGENEWTWPPYPAPPQTWSERLLATLSRHGLPAALSLVFLVLIAGLVWFWPPEEGLPALSERSEPGAYLQRESPDGRPPSPYEGKAEISVSSLPGGALVLVDGDSLGVTPMKQQTVSAGAHVVSVRKEGYADIDSVFILRNDQPAFFYTRLPRFSDRPEPLAHEQESVLREAESPAPARWEQQKAPAPQPASLPAPRRTVPAPRTAAEPEEVVQDSTAQHAEIAARNAARRYEKAIGRGDEFFIGERYEAALVAYAEALEVRPGDERAQDRTQRTRKHLAEKRHSAEQYQYYRARGDVTFEQKRYREAISAYEQALTYRLGDPYAEGRIAEAQKIIAGEEAAAAEEKRKAAINSNRRTEGGIYKVPDEEPVLVGGMERLIGRVRYPVRARERGVEGRVILRAIVSEAGEAHSIKVLRGIGAGCDQAAVRAVEQSEFRPATANGQPVAAYKTIMVEFRIQDR